MDNPVVTALLEIVDLLEFSRIEIRGDGRNGCSCISIAEAHE